MKEIAYQNKDIISKIFAETIKDKSLKAYGLDIPKIKQVLPTNLPIIEANELRLDNLFELEDESLAIIDYESTYKEENMLKYHSYVHRVLKRYYQQTKQFKLIRMIVIYTADVTPELTCNTLEAGCIRMEIKEAFLSQIDSETVWNKLQEKITNKEKLTEEEMMQFIILPLTYKGKEKKIKAIKDAVRLSRKIKEQDVEVFLLTGLLVFADKVIDREISDEIRRRIKMTKVGQLFEEEAIAREKEVAKDSALRMIQIGKLTLEEVASCVPTLTMDEIKELEKKVLAEQQ